MVSQKEKSFPKRKEKISGKQNKKSKPASGIRERDKWIRLQASLMNVYTWIQLVMEVLFSPLHIPHLFQCELMRMKHFLRVECLVELLLAHQSLFYHDVID